ncbi:MAG: hypothetical protein IIB53_14050 [Planctomycetes bacterium]|nr:hypothetical protein [Planctomycetota bacterium]MCH8260782.1 hypothetical protein [Planctomycetota bacterium]MCH8316160.1 hypothetical protein [Planctomycetota bacterium]
MEQFIDLLDDHMYVVVVSVIGVVLLLGSLIRAVTAVLTTSSREKSRREIAAYIAEGSITAEQGERLIRADVSAEGRRRA